MGIGGNAYEDKLGSVRLLVMCTFSLRI